MFVVTHNGNPATIDNLHRIAECEKTWMTTTDIIAGTDEQSCREQYELFLKRKWRDRPDGVQIHKAEISDD